MRQPKIKDVKALPDRYALHITWSDDTESDVDVSSTVLGLTAFASIREGEIFAQAKPGEWGWSVEWPGEVEMAAHNLSRMSKEQQGEAFPIEEFSAWLDRNHLSLSRAARELGLSRRVIAYYKSGIRPIPRLVGLACKGWEFEKRGA